MRIGDLAAETGVSKRLLRYYEEQGLLRPERLSNGYREYARSHVAAVRHIRVLLDAGMPTSAISRVLHCVHDEADGVVPSACPEMLENLRRERRRIIAAITQLQANQDAIDSLLTTALRDS
ncbi:MerR family transcriptional regulator [Spirillospora sp. NPDC047279]|uniref:MerR family transcriptional regulator n=1 Tax=Spirillospora sp. NPDC047279 TaxID=3155478 RepID=UPI0033C9A5E3